MKAPSGADTQLPYLTANLPGVGGRIKRCDEDFVVSEIPLYPAGGQGTHTYFMVEKRGLTTLAAIRIIAKALGRPARDIGYAGLKDAHAVTRQMLSIEHVEPAHVASLALNRIRILSVARHTNKIKLGHLRGNRFTIKIRDPVESPEPSARAILDVLASRGVPNYFGPQRFGVRGDNARIGRAVLQGDYVSAVRLILGRPGPSDRGDVRRAREAFERGDFRAAAAAWPSPMNMQSRVARALVQFRGDAYKAWLAVDHTLRKLFVSAVQSELFNRLLRERIQAIDRVEPGDLAWKHDNGACFLVVSAAREQPRCDAFEISPTGPLFGRRMSEAQGRPGALEAAVLAAFGPAPDRFEGKDGRLLRGARRPLRVPLVHPELDETADERGPCLRVTFELPPGAYATSVIREMCKAGG